MFSSAEEKEATDLLQNILRCNTTNPPGNEAVLAEKIKKWLASEEISCQIDEFELNRANLIFEIKGAAEGPKLLVTGHLDTVPPGNCPWQHDPFGAEIEEFHIWTNVKASAPKGSTATDETSATPKEIEIPCTASPNNFILDSEKKPVSEIVWRDDNKGTVRAKFDKLFADKSPGKLIDFINEALGTTTTPTTTVSGGS